MMEKLRALDFHYADVEARLSAPETYEDPALVARLNKEQRELEPVVMAYRAYQRRRQDLEDAEALMGDPDMKELAQEEYQQAREELARLEEEIKVLLLPRDPNDDKNVIVEIRAGVGGEEAALFAHSLFRMYSMYADARALARGGGLGQRDGAGRREGNLLYNRGRRGLVPSEIRERRPPGAAGA